MTSSQIVLTGRVMDDRGAVDLTVDGEPVAVAKDGAFLTDRQLRPGRNELIFVAADAAGNRAMKSVEVTVSSGEPPVTAAGSPAAGTPGRDGGPQPNRPQPGGPVRFADRGDGTLLDTQARLTWSKRPSDSALAWKASRAYCKKLDLGRKSDWMLPTIEELEELYRAGSGAPGSSSRPLSFPASSVWSDSKKGFGKAWAFDFSHGQRTVLVLAGDQATALKTLCVRRDADPRRPQPQGFDPPALGGGSQPPPRGGGPPPRGGGPPPPGGGGQGQAGGPANAQGNSQFGGGGGSAGKGGGKGGGHGGKVADLGIDDRPRLLSLQTNHAGLALRMAGSRI